MACDKPPLGVKPKWLWIEERIRDLGRAICEYAQAGRSIDQEWIDEYNELINRRDEYVGKG